MKTVYITRTELFKNITMIMCNNIEQADENFYQDNQPLYIDSDAVSEEIERMASIDWNNEEYKPYDITEEMTQEEIKDHLQSYEHDIAIDIDANLEVMQFFIIEARDYLLNRMEGYGVEIGYSEALNLKVLPVYDFGTAWSEFSHSKEVGNDYVLCEDETWERGTSY